MMRPKTQPILLAILAALPLAATPAAAQQAILETGGRVYGLVGAGFGDGTLVATGAGAGLRLTPRLGLDVELTHLSGDVGTEGLAAHAFGGLSGFPAYPPFVAGDEGLFPFLRFEDQRRDVTSFLTKFTVEFPIADGLVYPYLTGGGGVSRVTERATVVVDPISWADGHPGLGGVFLEPTAHAELGLAFVLGGGVDVTVWHGFGVGIDIRWQRVLRSYDVLDIAQATVRASYRF